MDETCATCGLPQSLCVCQDISRDSQKVRIRTVRKSFGKIMTMITGFEDDQQAKEIGKALKKKLACGGTVKNKEIELQGKHKNAAKEFLLTQGFKKELIDD